VTKPLNPLLKPQKYDGSKCLETFLLQFKYLASYMHWEEANRFHHMCASLEGPASHVLWELPQENPTTTDLTHAEGYEAVPFERVIKPVLLGGVVITVSPVHVSNTRSW